MAQSGEEMAAAFERDGYLLLRNFASVTDCDTMRAAMHELISRWDPATTTSVFRTDGKQEKAQGSDDYFLSSADKVRFFLEPDAVDPAGELRTGIAKEEALNKVGHALHTEVEAFVRYSQSAEVRRVVDSLGWRSPALMQSMYIFKQPRIGAIVTPHQDSSFLRTEPLSCLGLWLALQPATEANGCLWARPGSHQEPLRRHFARTSSSDGAVQMHFNTLAEPGGTSAAAAASWEGRMPDGVSPADLGFVPLPVETGDLVVIHGQLDHMSMPNTSATSRHSFQLHLVEGEAEGVRWDPTNWLQYPAGKPYPGFV